MEADKIIKQIMKIKEYKKEYSMMFMSIILTRKLGRGHYLILILAIVLEWPVLLSMGQSSYLEVLITHFTKMLVLT